MSRTNNFLFIALLIIAWLIFVGLSIEAGGLIVNFIFSVYNPDFVKNLYQKLDLSEMHNRSEWVFYQMYSFILSIAILKAILFYVVVILMHKIDMQKPFSTFVSTKIFQISYFTFSIGLLSYIARETAKKLMQHGIDTSNLTPFWNDSSAFILMAAVIYIIALIFKKGVDLQNENDLTV